MNVATYKVTCRACGEEFESEDGYADANEMKDAHEEAEHLNG